MPSEPARLSRLDRLGAIGLCDYLRRELVRGLDQPSRERLRRLRQARIAAFQPSRDVTISGATRCAQVYLRRLRPDCWPAGECALREPILLPGWVATYERVLSRVGRGDRVDDITRLAQAAATDLERCCLEAGYLTEELPAPTAQALRGLRALGSRGSVEQLRRTQVQLQQLVVAAFANRRPHDRRLPRVRLRETSSLWRWRATMGEVRITISARFARAPRSVLQDLATWCVAGGTATAEAERERVEAWSSERHDERHGKQRCGNASSYLASGVVYDLNPVHDQLREVYFDDGFSRPALGWSRSPGFGRWGEYRRSEDAIIVSSLLDLPDVPRSCVAYVVFHELVHRTLEARAPGLGRDHGPEFAAIESRFADRSGALADLDRLAGSGFPQPGEGTSDGLDQSSILV